MLLNINMKVWWSNIVRVFDKIKWKEMKSVFLKQNSMLGMNYQCLT